MWVLDRLGLGLLDNDTEGVDRSLQRLAIEDGTCAVTMALQIYTRGDHCHLRLGWQLWASSSIYCTSLIHFFSWW